jgi:uncharacterized protein YjbI with pentapeptide repeats
LDGDRKVNVVRFLYEANLIGKTYDGWDSFAVVVNLSRANLSDANLSEANLRGADLSGADLGDAKLSGTDLRDANLKGVRKRSKDPADKSLTFLSNEELEAIS